MSQFAQYYVDFLWTFVVNIATFFVGIGTAIYKWLVLDVIGYFQEIGAAVGGFDILGWIMLILTMLINATLVFFVAYRLFQLIRRYIIFRAKEVDKDKLLEEIARLKLQAEELVKEKNKIFALKVGANLYESDAAKSGDVASEEKEETPQATQQKAVGESRFSKLIQIDQKYARNPFELQMFEEDMLSLEDIVYRFINFAASQLHLYYTPAIIRRYFAGMATSKILILEGISGTGKTSLPYAMSKFFHNNMAIISVQPSWRDRTELIGYFNEFTKKFNETDFLAGLYECTLREDPNFIVLDEMNLARIEYYFADFLSIMEMPDKAEWKIDLVPTAQATDPENVVEGKILVPQNVWFIGTANNDDSTFTITDKVYDRAVAIVMNEKAPYFDAPLTEPLNCTSTYLENLFAQAQSGYSISKQSLEHIAELDEFVQMKFKIGFGNRIMKQIKLFVPAYIAAGGTELEGLDFILCTKILRKFSSLNLPFLQKELSELYTFLDKKFGKGKMPYCQDFIKDLQKMG